MGQRQSSSATATKLFMVVAALAASFCGASVTWAADAVCMGSLSGDVSGNVFVGSNVLPFAANTVATYN
jgi:hypothetical protein